MFIISLLIIETSAVTTAFITYISLDAENGTGEKAERTRENLYLVIHVLLLSLFFSELFKLSNKLLIYLT